jgi:hypothetical protein
MILDTLLANLDLIGRLNSDRFMYSIGLDYRRPGARGNTTEFGKVTFTFIAKSDLRRDHVFVMGVGSTIGEACDEAAAEVAASCSEWGYKQY